MSEIKPRIWELKHQGNQHNDWEKAPDEDEFNALKSQNSALKSQVAELLSARDAYAKAMAIAMEEGIFPHKEITKAKIFNVLNITLEKAEQARARTAAGEGS